MRHDSECEQMLTKFYENTKNDKDIHILNLLMANHLEKCKEINVFSRATSVTMQTVRDSQVCRLKSGLHKPLIFTSKNSH